MRMNLIMFFYLKIQLNKTKPCFIFFGLVALLFTPLLGNCRSTVCLFFLDCTNLRSIQLYLLYFYSSNITQCNAPFSLANITIRGEKKYQMLVLIVEKCNKIVLRKSGMCLKHLWRKYRKGVSGRYFESCKFPCQASEL